MINTKILRLNIEFSEEMMIKVKEHILGKERYFYSNEYKITDKYVLDFKIYMSSNNAKELVFKYSIIDTDTMKLVDDISLLTSKLNDVNKYTFFEVGGYIISIRTKPYMGNISYVKKIPKGITCYHMRGMEYFMMHLDFSKKSECALAIYTLIKGCYNDLDSIKKCIDIINYKLEIFGMGNPIDLKGNANLMWYIIKFQQIKDNIKMLDTIKGNQTILTKKINKIIKAEYNFS